MKKEITGPDYDDVIILILDKNSNQTLFMEALVIA